MATSAEKSPGTGHGGDTEDCSDGGSEGESVEEENEDDSSSDFDPEMDEVNVQFEVRPITDDSTPVIRRLLQQLLLKGGVDVSGLTELLMSQEGIGSVIQVETKLGDSGGSGDSDGEGAEREQSSSCKEQEEEEDEVCGVVSVINLTKNQSNAAVQSLTEHLLDECKKHSPLSLPQLSRLLRPSNEQRSVGLLVNERYLNIPPHVAPPLLGTLLNEVKEASRKGLPYNFESYLLLARSYLIPSPLASPPSKRRKRREGEEAEEKEREGERDNGHSSNLVLHCQEYEVIQEETVLTFSYPVSGEGWGCGGDRVFGGGWGFEDDSLQQTRTVMVVPADRFQAAIAKLSSTLT